MRHPDSAPHHVTPASNLGRPAGPGALFRTLSVAVLLGAALLGAALLGAALLGAALLGAILVAAPIATAAPDDRIVTHIYDVRDLLHRRPDFAAPKLGLGGVETIDLEEPEGGHSFTMEELVDLIRDAVGEELEIADARINAIGSNLVISLPARSHERLSTVFRGLRESGRAAYTIEARFLELDEAAIAELGLRPLRTARRAKTRRLTAEQGAELLAFVAAAKGTEVICAPRLTIFARQRAHFVVVDQSAYVDRFEIGPTGELTEPVVEVMNTGLTFEARVLPRRGRPGVILDWDVKVAQSLPADSADTVATGENAEQLPEPELEVPEVVTVSREGRSALGEDEFLVIRGLPNPLGEQEGRQTLLIIRCTRTEMMPPKESAEE